MPLIEILASITILAVIGAGAASSLAKLSSLSESSKTLTQIEDRLLSHHLGNIRQGERAQEACTFEEAGTIKISTCKVSESQKHTTTIRLSNLAGFSVIELLLSLCILSIVLIMSYPALKSFISITKEHLQQREEDLSLLTVRREIEARLAAALLLPLPGTVALLPADSKLYSMLQELPVQRRPLPQSAALLVLEPFADRIHQNQNFMLWMNKTPEVEICGGLQKNLVLAVSQNSSVLAKTTDLGPGTASCTSPRRLRVTPLGEIAEPSLFIAALRKAEIYFLDQSGVLRRYRIQERSTDPLVDKILSFSPSLNSIKITSERAQETIEIPQLPVLLSPLNFY